MLSGIPYSDSFYVQTRWVVTRAKGAETCRLQIGLEVVFRQTLLLRAAIRSGTEGETKRMLQDWLRKAHEELSCGTPQFNGIPTPGSFSSSLSGRISREVSYSSFIGGKDTTCENCIWCRVGADVFATDGDNGGIMTIMFRGCISLLSIVLEVVNARDLVLVALTIGVLTLARLLSCSMRTLASSSSEIMRMAQQLEEIQQEQQHLRSLLEVGGRCGAACVGEAGV